MNPERRIQSTSITLSSFKTGRPAVGSAGLAVGAGGGCGSLVFSSIKCLCISSVI